ncbi:MAG: hypothetical protein LUC48_08210 [Clostridiales bacterium]|nr:hypothetical protein [Clostridiales bacterium]
MDSITERTCGDKLSRNVQQLNALGLQRLADIAETLAGVPAYTDNSGKVISFKMAKRNKLEVQQ